MPARPTNSSTDRGQRRSTHRQARSQETKRGLVQAALALWRTRGYRDTTVADICQAAGVSKGLFYFYFARKEDVLYEIGAGSTRATHQKTSELLERPYEVPAVVLTALKNLERAMLRNTPELIIETILEGYRYEHRTLAGQERDPDTSPIFSELLERAQADGKLPPHVDVRHLAAVTQSMVSEGARHWAAGAYREHSFSEAVGRDIIALLAGYGDAESAAHTTRSP